MCVAMYIFDWCRGCRGRERMVQLYVIKFVSKL